MSVNTHLVQSESTLLNHHSRRREQAHADRSRLFGNNFTHEERGRLARQMPGYWLRAADLTMAERDIGSHQAEECIGAATSGPASASISLGDRETAMKRRASHACMPCRIRKVRCNAPEEIPCRRCRGDKVEVSSCDYSALSWPLYHNN